MTIQTISAAVESVTPLTDSILQIMLRPQSYIDYTAGQYLQIVREDEVYSYSIASAPLGSHNYELHIRHIPDNTHHQQLLAYIKKTGKVKIQLPFGDCHLNKLKKDKPILFIAAGTGFAPIKAMIEQLLANGDQRKFALFWGARSRSDLYMDEKVTHWHNHVPMFRYCSCLSTPNKDSLSAYILNEYQHELNNWQIVLSGPFDMVYHTRDQLVAAGAREQDLFSDAFSFESK